MKMLNGIIKLFYSEIVKTKINNLDSSGYSLRDECKEIRNITLKIDSVFFKLLKLAFGSILLMVAFNLNLVLGIGVFLIGVVYILYKRNMEEQVKEHINNVKNNIDISKITFMDEKGRTGLNALITLLLIGLLTGFNWILVASFVVIFVFTIKNVC
ncbi:hypothetical protein IC171_07210 [Clostridioides sp. ES-S-0171-01]|nr:hypothetical protein [Clostridioides sp. ES-S-0171-01]MCC0689141.1 hypothetical protein [Clostridioides sp. ES-S-0056-01]MCC0716037.1 hypothetical protein [Clostridioides sp. ES-S-0077-01]UDN56425.1 hypothetical protein JJC02_12995 [Clostridioides sp. ES-S-0054-01]